MPILLRHNFNLCKGSPSGLVGRPPQYFTMSTPKSDTVSSKVTLLYLVFHSSFCPPPPPNFVPILTKHERNIYHSFKLHFVCPTPPILIFSFPTPLNPMNQIQYVDLNSNNPSTSIDYHSLFIWVCDTL